MGPHAEHPHNKHSWVSTSVVYLATDRMYITQLGVVALPGRAHLIYGCRSGLTFMFVRSLKDAIYGQVWSALEVCMDVYIYV